MALYVVPLPGKKLLWKGPIISFRRGQSLLTITFRNNLINSIAKTYRSKIFKINWTINLWDKGNQGFRYWGIKRARDKSLPTNLQTSFPITCQYCLKNIPWTPLGPGALKGFIEFKALVTSSMVIGLVKMFLPSSSNLGILATTRDEPMFWLGAQNKFSKNFWASS